MNLCKTCGTICPFDDERTECDAYSPMTNENWFISLPTEEKAKWLADNFGYVAYKASGGKPKRVKEVLVEYWQEWLKQPHHEKE